MELVVELRRTGEFLLFSRLLGLQNESERDRRKEILHGISSEVYQYFRFLPGSRGIIQSPLKYSNVSVSSCSS